jgi:hypothetical protein
MLKDYLNLRNKNLSLLIIKYFNLKKFNLF